MSRHMLDATRAYIAAGGVRSLKEGVLLGDFSWKSTYSGYATGLWAHASQHSYSAGTSSQHLPKSQAIPAAHQWAPKENVHAAAFGLITMVSVYLKVWNIDLCTWFSAVMLDGFSTGHASVETVLPRGTLFSRNLPHQSRINVKKNRSTAFLMRNAEGAGQSFTGKKTGCRVCAMWAVSPQGQPLAYAMLALYPQGLPLDQFPKPRLAQSHP